MNTVGQVLFTAIVGALIGMVPTLFAAARLERWSRNRELWRKDADLCAQLEEVAGELAAKIFELSLLSGKFPRYPRIQQAIRDLHNTAGQMWADRNQYSSQEERVAVQEELGQRLRALLSACDEATGRNRSGI